MDGRPTWTDCVEAGDYVVPNVLGPRDLVFRPDNMDETVPHTRAPSNFTFFHCRGNMVTINTHSAWQLVKRIAYFIFKLKYAFSIFFSYGQCLALEKMHIACEYF